MKPFNKLPITSPWRSRAPFFKPNNMHKRILARNPFAFNTIKNKSPKMNIVTETIPTQQKKVRYQHKNHIKFNTFPTPRWSHRNPKPNPVPIREKKKRPNHQPNSNISCVSCNYSRWSTRLTSTASSPKPTTISWKPSTIS